MADFKTEYQKLNAEQRQAVDLTDGPLLVLAGPGTGKTQLLAMRVANILKQTDTDARSILCLTFTNKAAVNMKERIITLTGSTGSKTVVKTFHSFAAEIMNNYPDYFWNHASLSVVPDSVQLDIIESILSRLPLDHPLALKFAGQLTLTADVQRAISLAKDAGLTPEKLASIIQSNIAYISQIEAELLAIFGDRLSVVKLDAMLDSVRALPDQSELAYNFPLQSFKQVLLERLDRATGQDKLHHTTKQTSMLKQAIIQRIDGVSGLHKEHSRNEWWLRLAEVYADYRNVMHERGFYDYADMLVEVITQLEHNPDMLADIQERFLYVLIDEFQDSNPAQMRLASLISDHHSAEGKPNLMVVGDDDQSIFKFNGAQLSNMLNFQQHYPAAQLIILKENYRSTRAVLGQAKKVIEQAEDRLIYRLSGLDKNLTAQNYSDVKSDIQAIIYPSREEQLSAVAEKISQNFTHNQDIAVLARGHDSLIRMASLLTQRSIPIRYDQQSNILEHEIVQQVYLVMQLLQAIADGDSQTVDSLVHKIIRHPLWEIEPARLWQLAKDNFTKPDWLTSLTTSETPDEAGLGNWLVWLAQEAARQPLAVTLEHILGLRGSQSYTSPMRDYFLHQQQNVGAYFQGLSAIQLLRSLVNDFATSNQPSIADLIKFFEVNINNQKIIADESPFVTGSRAVQLLTGYKAKGLEFAQVYIIDVIEKNWQPRAGSRKPPMNLPLQPVGDTNDDYVRLLYVAITRARYDVMITGYSQNHSGSDVAISPIMQAAFDVAEAAASDQPALQAIIEQHLRWPDLSQASESDVLKARLQTYNLSVTDLINFLDIEKAGPQYFKERNLLRLPEAKSPILAYGTAMHAAMQQAQLLTNRGQFSLQKVIAAFDKAMTSEHLAVAEHIKFNRQGTQMLGRLFNEFNYQLATGSKPEQKYSDIALGDARISGKLDRVDRSDNQLVVVDYKTGSGVTSLFSNNKALQNKIWRYKTQLSFYNILLRQSGQLGKRDAFIGTMLFIEADDRKYLEQPFSPAPAEIQRLEALIQAVWRKVQGLSFPHVSGYSQDIAGVKQFEQDLIDGKL